MNNEINNQQTSASEAFGNINANGLFKENSKRNEFAEQLLAKRFTILERVLPNEVTKDILDHQKAVISQHGKQTREIQRIMGEYEVEAVKTALNAVLLKGKGSVVMDANVTFAKYKVQFATELERLQKTFNAVMMNKHGEMEKMPIPMIQEQMKKEITLEVESYYTMIARFIKGFQDLTENLVH